MPIRFVTDGVTSGTTGLVVETINKIEASLISRGYDVRYVVRQLDVMLHGKKAHMKWVQKHLPETDGVLLFNTNNLESKEVIRWCKEKGTPLVQVQARTVQKSEKVR